MVGWLDGWLVGSILRHFSLEWAEGMRAGTEVGLLQEIFLYLAVMSTPPPRPATAPPHTQFPSGKPQCNYEPIDLKKKGGGQEREKNRPGKTGIIVALRGRG